MALIAVQQSVQFSDNLDRRVIIESEAGFAIDGRLPIKIYPVNPDRVRATIGSVELDANDSEQILTEALTFERESRSQVDKPGDVDIIGVELMDVMLDGNNDPFPGVRFSFDTNSNEIIALHPTDPIEVNVTGSLRVGYNVRYSRYLYTPISAFAFQAFGEIVAIKNGGVAKFKFDPTTVNRNNLATFYVVHSEIVLDSAPESPWEKPPNFPTDNIYPGVGLDGPDVDSFLIDRRMHERGTIDPSGRQYSERYNEPFVYPFTGSFTWLPQYTFERRPPPPGYGPAFAEINWGQIEEAVRSRFPGVDIPAA